MFYSAVKPNVKERLGTKSAEESLAQNNIGGKIETMKGTVFDRLGPVRKNSKPSIKDRLGKMKCNSPAPGGVESEVKETEWVKRNAEYRLCDNPDQLSMKPGLDRVDIEMPSLREETRDQSNVRSSFAVKQNVKERLGYRTATFSNKNRFGIRDTGVIDSTERKRFHHITSSKELDFDSVNDSEDNSTEIAAIIEKLERQRRKLKKKVDLDDISKSSSGKRKHKNTLKRKGRKGVSDKDKCSKDEERPKQNSEKLDMDDASDVRLIHIQNPGGKIKWFYIAMMQSLITTRKRQNHRSQAN